MTIIKIDKKTCQGCQKCCHGTPGEWLELSPRVNPKTRTNNRPFVDHTHRCQYLNTRNNCQLGLGKPFECSIYPIIILAERVYVDLACPAWESAVEQWTAKFRRSIESLSYEDNAKYVPLWIAQERLKEC